MWNILLRIFCTAAVSKTGHHFIFSFFFRKLKWFIILHVPYNFLTLTVSSNFCDCYLTFCTFSNLEIFWITLLPFAMLRIFFVLHSFEVWQFCEYNGLIFSQIQMQVSLWFLIVMQWHYVIFRHNPTSFIFSYNTHIMSSVKLYDQFFVWNVFTFCWTI